MDADELRRRYKAGERDFSGANLRRIRIDDYNLSLSGVIFQGADLREAEFRGVNLSDANFVDANLFNAYLTGVDLRGADLRRANLESVYISWADLRNVNLQAANLKYARISETCIAGANLQNADLSQAELSYNNFINANFNHANLSGATLNGNDFMGVDLNSVQLTGVKRRGANLILSTVPKNPADLEVVEKLRKVSGIGVYSDGDYSTTFFLWEVPDKETITIQDIIEWGDYSENRAFEERDFWAYYSDLEYRETFSKNVSDIKMYFISEGFGYDEVSGAVDVYIVGKTQSGNFAGCSAQVGWT